MSFELGGSDADGIFRIANLVVAASAVSNENE